MSETILERMQAKVWDDKREIVEKFSTEKMLEIIATCSDMKIWDDLRTYLTDIIIENNYDIGD